MILKIIKYIFFPKFYVLMQYLTPNDAVTDLSEFARKIVHENPDCRNRRDGFTVGYGRRPNGGGGEMR